MNCNEVRQHWNLYHDSEGEAGLHFQIGEHLAMCPECAEWFHKQSRLEELITAKMALQPASPQLWNRVLAGAGVVQPARSRVWLLGAGLAACVAVLAMLYLRPSATQTASDLAQLGADWHERLMQGTETVPFSSMSDLEVENYLRGQVSFPVRCPPRKDAGFAVEGAGVCRLAEQPAAYLLGRVESTPVSIIIFPRDSLTVFPRQQEAVRKANVHRCREGRYEMVLGVIDRNAVLVIGQTEPQRLEKVLNAYGTYPDHHAG